MWNLSLCNILRFLVTFSASEQILPKTTALYTQTHTHKQQQQQQQQQHRQNIVEKIQANPFQKLFLLLLTAMIIIREFQLKRVITNFITFLP